MTIENRQRISYVVADYLSTALALLTFNILRYRLLPEIALIWPSLPAFLASPGVIWGMALYPPLMLLVYYLAGSYHNTVMRSRVAEFNSTAVCSAVGAVLYFFAALINDLHPTRADNYELILLMAAVSMVWVYIPRYFITARAVRRVRSGEWGFATLIIGDGAEAEALRDSLATRYVKMGLRVADILPPHSLDAIAGVIGAHSIKRIIVLPHPGGNDATIALINRLYPLDLPILITPDLYHLLMVRPRITDISALPLVDISGGETPVSTLTLKRAGDVAVSAAALLLLLPVFAVIAVAVKLDSPGPVFYRQQRVGYHKRLFNILKFRTMRVDAESAGPALSSENDPRITRVGHYLRKYRLDELPNFVNVLRGEMSIVGPRPERQFYISRIIERAPYYTLVHSVRPGITSWGMVRYGYATSLDGMVERLKYDIIYIDNISFAVDVRILIHTVKTVVTGRGM